MTNPRMMKGPLREVYPIGELEIRLRLPDGVTIEGVRLLCGSELGPVTVEDGLLTTTVSRVLVHEVLAVDLA
jgi:hypothetical protein